MATPTDTRVWLITGATSGFGREVDFGVRFLIVEPGAFRTGIFNPKAAYESKPMPEYTGIVGPTRDYLRTGGGSQPGDPVKAAQAILTAINAETPPLRLVLGGDAIDGIRDRLNALQTELAAWDHVGRATRLDAADPG